MHKSIRVIFKEKKHFKSTALLYLISCLFFIYVSLVIHCTSFAADSAGNTGADFLKMEIGARSTGMGNAFVAVVDDATAIYWNPAALSKFNYRNITLMHNELGEGITYESLSYSQPIKKINGGFGINTSLLNITDIDGYTPGGVQNKNLDFYDFAVSLAYGQKIINHISGGINLKIIQEKLDDQKATFYAFDIGCLYTPSIENIVFGLNIQNIGPKIKFIDEGDNLPLNIKLGGAWKNKIFGNKLITALDLNLERDSDMYINIGTEFWIHESIALRVGYNPNDDLGNKLSMGLGCEIKGLNLDYAFSSRNDFDDSHKISINFRFGKNYENSLIEKSIDDSFEKGKKYFLKGDLLNAYNQFKNLVTIAPGHEEAQEFLARTRIKVTEVVDATNITTHFNEGEEYYQAGELIQARIKFENILELDPNHQGAKDLLIKIENRFKEVINALLNQGIEYYKKDDYTKSLQELNKVLVLNPEQAEAKDYIIMIKEKLQKIEELKIYQKATKHYDLAIQLYKKNNFAESIIEFNNALAAVPDYKDTTQYIVMSKNKMADTDVKSGIDLYNKNQFNNALDIFQKALELNPGHKKAIEYKKLTINKLIINYCDQALKFYNENKLTEAINIFKEALKLDPGNNQVLKYISQSSIKLKEINNARSEECNKSGLLEYTKGNLKKAIESWEEALQLNPDLETAAINLKRAQSELKKK